MDGLSWKSLLEWDDLGVPLFLETPIWMGFGGIQGRDETEWERFKKKWVKEVLGSFEIGYLSRVE